MSKKRKKSQDNLLRLSHETEDFSTALKEWFFTGDIVDHQHPIAECELCEQTGLRYHFRISNNISDLLVGSDCIQDFDIFIKGDDGQAIATHQKSNYLKNKAKEKHVTDALTALLKTIPHGDILGFKRVYLDQRAQEMYMSNKAFGKTLNYLFIRFEEENIPIDKSSFKINIQSDLSKRKLICLDKIRFERILPALTKAQKLYYEQNSPYQ